MPGGYAKRFDAIDASGGENKSLLDPIFEDRERTVTIRQQEVDVAYKNIYGTADCCSLTAGYKFELSHHPAKENNIYHVLVNVQHEAVQSPSYVSDDAVSNAYTGEFRLHPARRRPRSIPPAAKNDAAGRARQPDRYGRRKSGRRDIYG